MAEVTQIPIAQIATYENVRAVDAIVEEAERGYFLNAALLVDQVLRDARIFSVLMTRILGLLGKPVEFEPPKETARATNLAKEIEGYWPRFFPHAALVELIIWGLMLNLGVAQIVEDADGEWTIEVWHPWAVRFDQTTLLYYVTLRGPSGNSEEVSLEQSGDGYYTDKYGTRWVLYLPAGYGNSGRRGLLRNLHHLFLERNWSHRDRSRYSEIFGQPMRVGIVPPGISQEKLDRFADVLSPIGAEPVAIVEQGLEGNRWDVKLVESAGRSTELFQVEIEQLDKEIATLILGQSQSTDGQGGLGTQENAGLDVRTDIMRADADTLSNVIREQFLVPYVAFAYGGDGEQAPWPCWKVEPPDDTKKRAEEFYALMQGLQIAKLQGFPVNVRELLDKHNIPTLTEEEERAMKAEQEAEAQAKMQAQAQAMAQAAQKAQPNGAQKPPAMPMQPVK